MGWPLSEKDFDLVLMDLQMPVMDGRDATREILRPDSIVRNHRIPIIALTAHAMKSDQESCLAAGINAHVTKPLNINVLNATICRVLAGKSRLSADLLS